MDRRHIVAASFMVLLMAVSLSGCLGGEETIKGDRISIKYDETMTNELVIASNSFAFDLNKALEPEEGGNAFFSPYSITIALGMAFEGARGQTAAEISSVLNITSNETERHSLVHSIQSGINAPNDAYELNTANAFWVQNGYPIRPGYEDILQQIYLAYGQSLDLRGDPSGSADTINTWVEDKTNDLIKDLLSPGDLTPVTALVLTNAIYFKGTWQYTFDEEGTEKEDFLTPSGSEAQADMMKMCDRDKLLFYNEKDGLKMLELPYEGDALSMFVILPSDRSSGTEVLDIDESTFRELHDSMQESWIDLWLPKFEVRQKYDLSSNLSDMGMPTAFGSDADFSGIDGTKNLFIGKVIHQSFVKVDEEGTEAAAATAVIMDEGSAMGGSDPQPEEFHADHPFLFLIQHKGTGQILFMGRMNDPTA